MANARARRYARAVFDLATEEGDLAGWGERLRAVQAVLTDPLARRVLGNPSMGRARREEALQAIATPGMGKEGLNLARMLVENRRLDEVDGVVEEFDALADRAEGRVRATVTTAVELTDGDRKRLEKGLNESVGSDVRLLVRVDPKILGGLILQVGDRLTDASVATRLQQLRRRLAAS